LPVRAAPLCRGRIGSTQARRRPLYLRTPPEAALPRFLAPQIKGAGAPQVLDNPNRRNQNLCMAEYRELSRVRRRSRPHHPARLARLRLEAEIYRPRLIPVMLRLTVDQIAKIDAERRIPSPTGVPSRCAVVRALIDEGFAFRLAARPRSSGPGRGVPYPINLD
jgi:hypothetical protein